MTARQIALHALEEWRGGARFADAILQQLLADNPLAASDRGFATELFYGVLRNLIWLDFAIGFFRRGPIDPGTRDLLRLGIYQLLFLETPAHAAVYETVELAARRSRTVVNGVLRSAARRKVELQESVHAQPLATQTSHPDFLLRRWRENFGDQAARSLAAWNNQPAPLYARINQLKISEPEFMALYPGGKFVADHPGFAWMAGLPQEALARGECYMQDPSTALACHLLDPQPEENVLDACAAPGGKTALIAECMQNRGTIVSCDRDPARIEILQNNVTRLGVTIARVAQHDWAANSPLPKPIAATAPFARILVDAPCSNTGVMRRRVDLRWRLRAKDFAEMQKRQLAIVRAVIPLLKPGGILVYSTCSIEPEENEDVGALLRAAFPFLQMAEARALLPFRDGVDGSFALRLQRSG